MNRAAESPSVTRALVGPLAALAVITLALALDASSAPSVFRYLLVLPALWAAFAAGATAAAVVGLLAGLVQVPFALQSIERLGLDSHSVDGLVSIAGPAAFGLVVGRLSDLSRARAARLQAVLGLQRGLVHDSPFDRQLSLATEQVRSALGVDRLALVMGLPPDPRIVAAASTSSSFCEESAVDRALRDGRPLFVRDIERDPRFGPARADNPIPVRALVVPLDSGSGPIGALAVERAGDLPSAAREAVRELALHLALAIDNARLTLRQRRFAAELEEKVEAATERLRELDRAKTEFVSVVAHELRTPLTALQGFTELLLSRAVSPERQARYLGHLHNEAQRLGRIVAELLDLSRIETGRSLELRREPVELGELLERNVEIFAAQNQRHRFEWTAPADLPAVPADRDAIDRILKNLISNAVKYSPNGGLVGIAARPALDRPGMVEISVEDAGVGIPAAELHRIFDKYVRIPNTETVAVRGLGLGLTLVRGLVEAHGGTVEVQSLPGKGSIFRVLLPSGGPVLADFPYSSLDTPRPGRVTSTGDGEA